MLAAKESGMKWLKEFANSSRPLWIMLCAAGIGIAGYFVYMTGVQHGLKNLDTPEMISKQREIEDMPLSPAMPAVGAPGHPTYREQDSQSE